MQEFKLGGGKGPASSWAGFVPGAAFMVMGLLVLIMPDLLRLMVAALLMGLGFLLLALAWQVRKGSRGTSFMAYFQDRMRGPMDQ
ncbi:MAG: hypothetical protein ACYTG5_02220 [Planctomycetota bacterium]|jgi:hypothetical protein